MPAGPPPEAAVTPAVSPGDDLDGVRAALAVDPAPGTRVHVDELIVRGVAGGALVAPEAAAPGDRALGAYRVCRRQVTWTRSLETARLSWYLLRDGALVAYDHAAFAADCTPVWSTRPAAEDDRAVERALRGYLQQRHPDAEASLPERLVKARSWLAAGRDDVVLSTLEEADRRIEALRSRLDAGGLDDAEREALTDELDAVSRERAALAREAKQLVRGRGPAAPAPAPGASDRAPAEGLLQPGAPPPRPVAR